MTDHAAQARPAPTYWSAVHSLALLLAAIAVLLLITATMALREPSHALSIDEVQCRPVDPVTREEKGAAEHRHLPFTQWPASIEPVRALRCNFELYLTGEETRNLALIIPAFSDSLAIFANGQALGTSELYLMRNLRIAALPAFVPSLDPALVPGTNHFEVTVSALPGKSLALDRIYVGDSDELRSYHHSRWLLSAVIPTIVVGSEIALAIVFGLIWAARPREREFGWLAAMLVLAATRGSAIIPDFGLATPERPFWNLLVVWEALAALMFCRALTRMQAGSRAWLLVLPPLVFTSFSLLGPIAEWAPKLLVGAMGLVAAYLVASVWTLARPAMRGDRDALLVLPGMIVLLVFVSHDISIIVSSGTSRIFLARAVYGCFLLTVAALMTFRFVRAMNELDNAAIALQRRAAEVEEQLRGTYEELRKRREQDAIERERARLMRDLHDGIGAELAIMLALADSDQPQASEIARHARAALADMRLIIGSLDDYGGDLPLALGTWRERAEPQLRAAGLQLIWEVEDTPSLSGMGPSHVLDVLRIVQEAATNAIKHARARRLWVRSVQVPEGIRLTICDDGPGFEPHEGGNGIANMHRRAARLGARLSLGRSDGRTCVCLQLPWQLPSLEGR